MDKIAELIYAFLQPLKLPARLVAIAFVVTLIAVSFYGYERSTGYFYFSKIERKISLLKELQNIKLSGVEQNPELYPIYKDTVKELSSFDANQSTEITFQPVNWASPETLWKAISGSFVWILVFAFSNSVEIKRNKGIILVFILCAALLFAWIGAIIPTVINPWINYILFPLVQIIVLAFLTRKTNTEHANNTQSQVP